LEHFRLFNAGYLYGYTRFRQKFELPIVKNEDENARAQLRKLIAPFVLRRLKTEVLTELPPKVNTVIPIDLDREQRTLYTAAMTVGLKELKNSEQTFKAKTGEAKMKIFALMTRLRQICCDPSLCYEDYKGESSKLEACMELLSEAKNGGHKVLLFSQFTSMLSIIRKRLDGEGISYMVLQGSTPKEKRLGMVERFNEGNTDVFLISLKAGGTGLNLTGANVVIHYDPWWNMAAQEQATDRAHRIGQTQSVQVYKLIAANTIEEKILRLQEMKGDLASVIEADGEQPLMNMSVEDMLELLESR
jgi:SNF2 family DNA or RNA helicase